MVPSTQSISPFPGDSFLMGFDKTCEYSGMLNRQTESLGRESHRDVAPWHIQEPGTDLSFSDFQSRGNNDCKMKKWSFKEFKPFLVIVFQQNQLESHLNEETLQ